LSETSCVSVSSVRHSGGSRNWAAVGTMPTVTWPESPREKSMQLPHRFVSGRMQQPRARQQRLARWREADAAPRALEQVRTEHPFEAADAARERRLREMQVIGGAAEVTELGDGFEVTQVTEIELSSHCLNHMPTVIGRHQRPLNDARFASNCTGRLRLSPRCAGHAIDDCHA
jgi:hypothetical protein